MSDQTGTVKECHPNCGVDKCVLAGSFNNLRAQDCTDCANGLTKKDPLGCTNEYKASANPSTVNGFLFDHSKMVFDNSAKFQVCLNGTSTSNPNLFSGATMWYILMFAFFILLALIGLIGYIAIHGKKSKALTKKLNTYTGPRELIHINDSNGANGAGQEELQRLNQANIQNRQNGRQPLGQMNHQQFSNRNNMNYGQNQYNNDMNQIDFEQENTAPNNFQSNSRFQNQNFNQRKMDNFDQNFNNSESFDNGW